MPGVVAQVTAGEIEDLHALGEGLDAQAFRPRGALGSLFAEGIAFGAQAGADRADRLHRCGNTPYSVAMRRSATPDSICLTSRGQSCGHLPQVVQRQMSSLSISVRPKVASRTSLRMLKLRTRFQGQTVSHRPHW